MALIEFGCVLDALRVAVSCLTAAFAWRRPIPSAWKAV